MMIRRRRGIAEVRARQVISLLITAHISLVDPAGEDLHPDVARSPHAEAREDGLHDVLVVRRAEDPVLYHLLGRRLTLGDVLATTEGATTLAPGDGGNVVDGLEASAKGATVGGGVTEEATGEHLFGVALREGIERIVVLELRQTVDATLVVREG
jgi:hypothetical protein